MEFSSALDDSPPNIIPLHNFPLVGTMRFWGVSFSAARHLDQNILYYRTSEPHIVEPTWSSYFLDPQSASHSITFPIITSSCGIWTWVFLSGHHEELLSSSGTRLRSIVMIDHLIWPVLYDKTMFHVYCEVSRIVLIMWCYESRTRSF